MLRDVVRLRGVGLVVVGLVLWFAGLALALFLHGCGGELPAPGGGGCSPYAPEGRCVCDGGAPGVEVCARADGGGYLPQCRCH